jgi:hypothetical protein
MGFRPRIFQCLNASLHIFTGAVDSFLSSRITCDLVWFVSTNHIFQSCACVRERFARCHNGLWVTYFIQLEVHVSILAARWIYLSLINHSDTQRWLDSESSERVWNFKQWSIRHKIHSHCTAALKTLPSSVISSGMLPEKITSTNTLRMSFISVDLFDCQVMVRCLV